MIMVSDDRAHVPDLEFEIERLRRLANDLERIRNGNHPDEAALSNAPVIEGWSLKLRPSVCLSGRVLGHPHIEEGDLGVTTEIFAFAPTLGYARTLSRYYRLGLPQGVPPDRAQ